MVDLINLVQTLTTPHPVDRYLELIRPTLTLRQMRAEITEVDRSVPGSVTLTLRAPRQWRGHAAGQYVQIGVVIDGVRHTRCYSPIDPEGARDRRIRLTIKAHPEGLVSQYLHAHAAPGMVVDLSPAEGVFRLPDERPERILLIGGGSGITPVLSMLRTLVEEGHPGQITFLYYARSPEEVPHRAELHALARRHPDLRLELRYPERGDKHFDYDELERVAPWFADGHTFLCGPPPLMAAVRTVFEAERLDDRLHSEEFVLTTAPVDPDQAHGTVHFSASGVRADNSGASLLDQAEAAGLSPEYGCRMGICFSCTAVRRSGCTRNLRTGETDSDPDQPIQLCVSAPVGDVDIDI
ncbi:ferredoxin reductase [Nocardia farcinica]|uniref:ferredoxin reductase n=1 Tax=Nocardia farcinica TaxID=37329 RepID=UPI000E067EE4|nr:ferredoxin reductase [Nocardia farcinica]MBF6068369.1 ferredoxin reductase [Nocardia farcinica]MBF6537750.1 ferredoxin reductase [Nocardia farcinica]SUE30224.1 NADPH oxidoreductase [Nocardia farcinica]